ncbi:MAG TPA: STAS domain-containing protein [Spirochaetota bacterium]|nr:STAS domain-containing protein [Spirochaetota bacterium]HRZ26221.1 STAS domain-containing protein [Spirochaetota bacterium]HSA14647.1 STAS domain-containing protein [Spirochaetota bacterium]
MGVFQYSSSKHGKVTLINVGGSLDSETAPRFDEKLRGEIGKGASRLVCNMSKLDYIASAGLGVLIGVNDTLRKKGGEIKISEMNEKITKIFKLLGFINLFKIYKTDDEALDSF